MIIGFYDRNFKRIGTASDERKVGAIVSDFELTRGINSGANTLEFDLHSARELASAGNYIIIKKNGKTDFFTIIECEDTLGVPHIYAEDAGLDLLNVTFSEYSAKSAHTADFYINLFAGPSGFDVGVNEMGEHTRTLKWDSENTAAERIVQTANRFGAELQYRFEFDENGTLRKYIDIYERIGAETGKTLRVGKEITSLTIKESITELATGLKPVGGTPEGAENPITLADLTIPYDDGDIYSQGSYLLSRSAFEEWKRYGYEMTRGSGHLLQVYSYNTDSVSELLSRSVSRLKKIKHTALTYTAEISPEFSGVNLGDSVTVVDSERDTVFKARVTELVERTTAPKYTLEVED